MNGGHVINVNFLINGCAEVTGKNVLVMGKNVLGFGNKIY